MVWLISLFSRACLCGCPFGRRLGVVSSAVADGRKFHGCPGSSRIRASFRRVSAFPFGDRSAGFVRYVGLPTFGWWGPRILQRIQAARARIRNIGKTLLARGNTGFRLNVVRRRFRMGLRSNFPLLVRRRRSGFAPSFRCSRVVVGVASPQVSVG